jgi:type IV pilus assembly protein PilA
MAVVAVIGILAALAVFGVRRYLTSAKTAEAKNIVGSIARAAITSYERESPANVIIAQGSSSAAVTHALCTSAAPVPGAIPAGTKYVPVSGAGADFQAGTLLAGWRCLKVNIEDPIYYRYTYFQGGGYVAPANPAAVGGTGFEAAAQGDLDNNGIFSTFARTGAPDANGQLQVATQLYILNETE